MTTVLGGKPDAENPHNSRKGMTNLSLLIAALAAIALSADLAADTCDFTWTDQTGDHKWGTAGNWSPAQVPTAGTTVEIPCNKPEIIVDDDSAASFASVANISHSNVEPVTRLSLEMTTNVTLLCTMTSYASFRLKNDITVTVPDSNNANQNFTGFNILERGTFRMPQVASSATNGKYQYGRFTVSNDATLVIAPASVFYQLKAYGTVQTTLAEASLSVSLSTKDNPGLIAGPIEGKIKIDGLRSIWVTGMNNPNTVFSMSSSGSESVCGIARFGLDSSDTACSFGGSGSLSSDYDGMHFLYLGPGGETTAKTFTYVGINTYQSANYWNYPTVFDGGEKGGVTFSGTISPASMGDTANLRFFAHRIVFDGQNSAGPCVFSGRFRNTHDLDFTNSTHYVTKRGVGTWRFKDIIGSGDTENYSVKPRNFYGVFAVEEGTLQFDSIAEKGVVSAIGRSSVLQHEYKGLFDPDRNVDYAYLLGTVTNGANGSILSATEGCMEFSGTNASCSTTRPFRLLGDGRIGSLGHARIALGDFQAVTNGEKTLTLDGSANDRGDTLKDIRDGAGVVSVVKRGGGIWQLTGELAFSGDLKVEAGTLVISNPSEPQPYKWFRFTYREAPTLTDRFGLGKLAFYDKDGRRQGISLSCNQPETGYKMPDSDYEHLAAGSIMFGRQGYRQYLQNSNFKLSSLSSDSTTAKPFVTIAQLDTGSARQTRRDDPDSHQSVVVRLAEDTPDIVSYDLATPNDTSTYMNSTDKLPSCWTLEGSPDGVFFDLLDKRDDVTPPSAWGQWYSDKTAFAKGAVRKYVATDESPKGYPISVARAPRSEAALANVRSVSVSAGAVLRFEGNVAPLSKLKLDAAGGGTLDGVSFADAGILEIENAADGEFSVPITFANTSDAGKLSGWRLTLNGRDVSGRRTVSVSGGRICVHQRGFRMIFR